MKISNELLSAVLDKKVAFMQIFNNRIFFSIPIYGIEKSSDNIFYDGFDNSDPNDIEYFYYINLDTFIQLALYGNNEAIINAKRKEVIEALEWCINDSDNWETPRIWQVFSIGMQHDATANQQRKVWRVERKRWDKRGD